jgi:glycosyltransferase involved in cell wall biosynthesis
VLALTQSDTDLAEVIERSACGWILEPDRPDLLAAKVREIVALSRSELTERGESGRQYALRHFSREANLGRMVDILEMAVREVFTSKVLAKD